VLALVVDRYNGNVRLFRPLLPSPDALTVAASFWPRRLDERRFPVQPRWHDPEPGVRVLVHSQQPRTSPLGRVVLVHGLEGSVESGYMRGAAQTLLERGYAVSRLNLRGCGASESLSSAMYHAGLTKDLHTLLMELNRVDRKPVFIVGFSLGGNVVLKLAAELGSEGCGLLAGVCAASTPIDLEACVRRLGHRRNRVYEWRFLRSMKQRMRRRHRLSPERFPLDGLDRVSSVFEFDDRFVAPHFGFQDAAEYYGTQSAARWLDRIRVRTLLVQAQDDPLMPFEVFDHPAIRSGRRIELLAPEHGGHMGFLSRGSRRFWLDDILVEWMAGIQQQSEKKVVS